jgi:hypothetical protein
MIPCPFQVCRTFYKPYRRLVFLPRLMVRRLTGGNWRAFRVRRFIA